MLLVGLRLIYHIGEGLRHRFVWDGVTNKKRGRERSRRESRGDTIQGKTRQYNYTRVLVEFHLCFSYIAIPNNSI
jgi:hypothetical protein